MDGDDPAYYLDINGLSYHFGNPVENELNYGLGITREIERDNVIKNLSGGYYKNSFNDYSAYATAGLARRFNLPNNYYTDIGATAGVLSGYAGGVKPIAMPYAALGLRDLWKLRLFYGADTKTNDEVLMMNLGIPFK